MKRSTAADAGDALLMEWARYQERLFSSCIGYPSATAEGRANIATTHRPPGPRVPMLDNWPESVRVTGLALRYLDRGQRQAVEDKYLNGCDPPRGALRDARVFVAGFHANH